MLGWLHSRRKGAKQARIETISKPALPDAGDYEYLLEYLMDCGPAMPGVTVLTWQEIDSYVNRTGVLLASWEAIQIRKLSRIYANAFHRYTDSLVGPPSQPSTGKRISLSEKMKRGLRANG